MVGNPLIFSTLIPPPIFPMPAPVSSGSLCPGEQAVHASPTPSETTCFTEHLILHVSVTGLFCFVFPSKHLKYTRTDGTVFKHSCKCFPHRHMSTHSGKLVE